MKETPLCCYSKTQSVFLLLLFFLREGAIYDSLHIIGSQVQEKLTHTLREITTHIFRTDKKELIQKVQKTDPTIILPLFHALIQKNV